MACIRLRRPGAPALAGLGAVAGVLALAGVASAQSPGASAGTVDEVVVTAQKRLQRLQDVPVTVNVVSGEAMAGAGVRDIKDLQVLVPGLIVASTANTTQASARIRGVGTVGDNPGLESSVGVVIDGVYRPRVGAALQDLGLVDRVEVLKGPQGTVFGKNTSAGVINVVTRAPSFEPMAEGEVTRGNYDAWGGSVYVTGPLIGDRLAGSLFAAGRKRDGFYTVRTGDGPRDKTDDDDQDYWTVRGQALLKAAPGVDVRASLDYTHRDERCCVAVQLRSGPSSVYLNSLADGGQGVAPAADGYGFLPHTRTAYSSSPTGLRLQDGGGSVEVDAQVPSLAANLTAISAARFWRTNNGYDADFSGADVFYRNASQFQVRFATLSQELRLAGTAGRVDWLVGGFFADEELHRTDSYALGSDYNAYLSDLLTGSPSNLGCFTAAAYDAACLTSGGAAGPVFAQGLASLDHYGQTSVSGALFTNDTVHLTDRLDLVVGLRYTAETKTLDQHQTNANSSSLPCTAARANGASAGAQGLLCLPWTNPAFDDRVLHDKHSNGALTGTAKAAWKLTSQATAWASYARGYKAGGYNLDRQITGAVPDPSTWFKSETVDAFEVGLKASALSGALTVDISLFHERFEDFQLNSYLGTGFVVESIPSVTARGVDLDARWRTPIRGLTLQGGGTWAESQFGRFTAADLNNPGHFPSLSLLPGSRLAFAPKWSLTGQASFEREVGAGLRVLADADVKWQSQYNTGSDLLPAKTQNAYALLDGRVGVGSVDQAWTLELWGQNLTGKRYLETALNAPLQGSAFQSTVQPNGTYYNPALTTQTYDAFLGDPRTFGVTLRLRR